jgi:hypothetical protein
MGIFFSSPEKTEYEKIISEKDKEIEKLKSIIGSYSQKPKNISNEKIMEWIDAEISKPENNITWMPDGVEKKLKLQIFTIFLNLIDHMLSTTKIEFINHKISINIDKD